MVRSITELLNPKKISRPLLVIGDLKFLFLTKALNLLVLSLFSTVHKEGKGLCMDGKGRYIEVEFVKFRTIPSNLLRLIYKAS